MPDPVAKFESRIRGVPIKVESELQALISESNSMALDKKEYPSGFDNNEEPTTADDEYSFADEVHGKQLNNNFRHPTDTNSGATGTVIEEDDVLYVQTGLCNELFYEPCNIYEDKDDLTIILAHSTDSWSLCDSAPTFKDNPMVIDNNFDE